MSRLALVVSGLQAYPPESPPNGAFSKIEDVAGPGEEGVALRTIMPVELILASEISGDGERATRSKGDAGGHRRRQRRQRSSWIH
jgi:hypothetical protein